jgi:hypothetical protein
MLSFPWFFSYIGGNMEEVVSSLVILTGWVVYFVVIYKKGVKNDVP